MNGVSNITITEDVVLVTFHNMPNQLGLISEVFNQFAEAGISIDMISQTAPHSACVSVSFTISTGDTMRVLSLTNKLCDDKNATIKPMVATGNCKIQLYGEEMRHLSGVAAKVIATVASAKAELSLITTSDCDISLLVSQTHAEDAIAALEAQFGVKAK